MSEATPGIEVALVIVSYNSRDDLRPCLDSVLASDDSAVNRRVIVVDNASADDSADFVEQHYPDVDLVRLHTNVGFAGGCNAGWRHVQRHCRDAKYLALLNPDTVVEGGWLGRLVEYMESHPGVGAAQPKILLREAQPGGARCINTVGNRSNYMGFGYMTGYGQRDEGQYDTPRPIDFASGAAMIVRIDLLGRVGLFDDAMFMYLEDAELSWKLRQIGFEVHYVPGPAVLHRYTADAPRRHHYELERNRYILLLTYYHWRTLFLLMPMLTVLDLGMWVHALMIGKLRDQWRVFCYFFGSGQMDRIMENREQAQQRRRVSDRQFMGNFSGTVHLPGGDGFLLRWIGNPLFAAYWWVARRLLLW